MSWLARSIANSLRLDDDESTSEAENDVASLNSQSSTPKREIQREGFEPQSLSPEQIQELQSRGVKEDLTELKQTLSRQLWGVASFLAPPAAESDQPPDDRSLPDLHQSEPDDRSISRDEGEPSVSGAVTGISGDFADIGGRLSKMASDYFPFGLRENEEENAEANKDVEENEHEEEEEEIEQFYATGITEEVLAFASNIAHHPETWLDFPLDPEEDLDDFEMSEDQREHALVIEHLAPRLAALRIELCPCHMSESYFWKVYFVLLHSRLNKHDAEILSTPQVMEARAMWMKELQKQTKEDTDWYGRSASFIRDRNSIMHEDLIPASSSYSAYETMSPRTNASEPTSSIVTDYETEKHPDESAEVQFVDKSVIQEKPLSKAEERDIPVGTSTKISIPVFEDEEDDSWPEDEDSEFGGYSGAAICVGSEEDISFSDLEDFDDYTAPLKSKTISKGFGTSKT